MKRTKLAALLFVFIGLSLSFYATAQRPLTVEDLVEWKRVTDRAISRDGKWAAATIAPWDGDPSVFLYNTKGKETAVFSPADNMKFSSSSDFMLVRLVPARQLTDSLKLAKAKKEAMPMNSLLIRNLSGGEEIIDSVKTYKLAEEADWIAYQRTEKDKTLTIRHLDGGNSFTAPDVTEFGFARKGPAIYYHTKGDTLGTVAGLYSLVLGEEFPRLIKEGKEVFKNIAFSEDGGKLAFLFCEHKDSSFKAMSVWLSDKGSDAREIAARTDAFLPEGWVISENGRVSFSKNGERLFFGTSPEPRRRDTTVLAEKHPVVQVWNWDEPVQYTVQSYNKERDKKKSYMAVYNLPVNKAIQLASPETPVIQTTDEGNAEIALLTGDERYSLPWMWEGRNRMDVYTVSLDNGEKKLLREATYDNLRLSPAGKYAYTYSQQDSLWYSIDIGTGTEYRLTSPDGFAAWNEDFDMPDHPHPHGVAGWTENDERILIYDRYDIWMFDPKGAAQPVNLTVNGRNKGLRYRYLRLDREERFIDTGKKHLLSGFDEKTKGSGYYETSFASPGIPKTLIAGEFMLGTPVKAQGADAVIFTKETYEQYPELLMSDLRFRKPIKLTRLGEQQKGVRWGTAELVSWVSLDGKKIEGVVYKPADFDPAKKYPLLVNFYERNSETLHRYHTPQPGRSTIDYRMYNSHGYIIFNPDVVFGSGYPGEDSFNCVMPGISMLVGEGYIDENAIGAQGHSWGGYQVAYLATRTDLFAAIESGAPVVNMFSAYGGIRWGSGLARAFQYEHGQSRIGGSPWDSPRQYFESSPLFHMDKVTTPILIMHNDNDGHVPWYQGIEYFVALKRLGKPSWLLNYTGEIHWPDKMANRIDFQKRMFQFFDHYLKGAPMPAWMKDGVRAVDADFETGY